MDILEIIDDREPPANGQLARPFSCPWSECEKVSASSPSRSDHHVPNVRRTRTGADVRRG